jgi:hypothetical protein
MRNCLLTVAGLCLCCLVPLSAQTTKPAPPTPIDAKKAELGGKTWDPAWDKIVEQSVPQEMLSSRVPHDVRKFCPRFYTMSDTDKRVFWAYFLQALAGTEAGLNPTSRVRHTEPEVAVVDHVTHKAVRSEGLLQLTYEDATRYGCDFDWTHDRDLATTDPSKSILQPKNNLECGVKILNNQIITQRRSLISRKSYWSPLQPGTVPHRTFAKQMINPPAACEAPVKAPKLTQQTTASVHEAAEGSGESR